MTQAIYTKEKEGFMIKILSTSVPDNQPLTSQETKTAVSIFDFINKCFESLGLGIRIAGVHSSAHCLAIQSFLVTQFI